MPGVRAVLIVHSPLPRRRALLSHSPQLAAFFGRRGVNDVLLPLLITCLNAGSWQLRGAFFGAVAGIGPYGGRDSLDVFLLPCLEQALVDQEAAVVADAVACVAAAAPHLRKANLLTAAKKVRPRAGSVGSSRPGWDVCSRGLSTGS